MEESNPPKDGSVIETNDGLAFYNPIQDKWRMYPEGYLLGEFDDWKPAWWKPTKLRAMKWPQTVLEQAIILAEPPKIPD